MNPVYKMYLEDLEKRKRFGLPPLGYTVTPEGKFTMDMSTTFEDDIPGGGSSESTTEWGQYLTPSQYGGAYRKGQEKAMDTTYWLDKQYPTKKKTVITQEDGKPTKKVTTETEDTEGSGERTQYDIMMEQFADHAAGNTGDTGGFSIISNAEAAERGLMPRQKEDGSWWWWDKIKQAFVGIMQQSGGLNQQGVGDLILDENLEPTQAITDVAEGVGTLFETTAEREARLRQREFEQQRPMQDYQGALAGLIGQTPTGQMGSGEVLPGSAAWSTVSPSGEFIQRGPPASMPEGFMTPAREQEVAEQAIEDRIWGNYKYDVGAARKQYETDMAEIYKKAMQLSMFDIDPSAFVTLATKRMEQTSAFDEQERLQKIQRGIYYTEDGKWDPPSSKRVAFNRAKKFGAGVKLASAISDYNPGKEKKTGAMQAFYKFVDGAWETKTIRSGSDRADELVAEGYSVDRPYVERDNKSVDASLMRDMSAALDVGNIDAAVQAYVNRQTAQKFDPLGGGLNLSKIKAAALDIVWDRLKYRYNNKVTMVDEMPPNDPEKLRKWLEELHGRGILYIRLPDGTITDIIE